MHSPALDLSLRVKVSPDELWDAVTKPKHLRSWWPDLELEANDGGRIEVGALPDGKKKLRTAKGKITRFDEGERLRWTWKTKGNQRKTTVAITVSKAKKRAKIRVVETGFGLDDDVLITVERMRDYWRDRLCALAEYLDAASSDVTEKTAKGRD